MTGSSNDDGYLKRRSFQQMSNLGELENAAPKVKFAESVIEEDKGVFTKMGRDPDAGVAVAIQNYAPTEQNVGTIFLTEEDAMAKAERTGITNARVDGNYYVGDDPEQGPMILGRAILGTGEEGAGVGGAGVPEQMAQEVKEGSVLGDIETLINAPFAGFTRGMVEFGANVLGATGALDQEKVDEFFQKMDEVTQSVTEGRPGAAAAGMVGEIAGQFVVPAVGAFSKLRALGASPVMASILSEAGVGLLGISPNEENLFNLIPEGSDAAAAVKTLMATDPEDAEWVNRSRNAVEALALLGGGEAAVRGTIAGIGKAKELIKTDAGQQFQGMFGDFLIDETGSLDLERLTGGAPAPREDVFFSPVERAVEGITQEKGSAKQFRSVIAKTPGVKEEELAWMGLDDFLSGRGKITKQELSDFVRQNKTQVETVTLVEDPARRNLVDAETGEVTHTAADIDKAMEAARKDMEDPTLERSGVIDFLMQESEEGGRKLRLEDTDPTKFSSYNLPGGTNYREVLIKLPQGERSISLEGTNALRDAFPQEMKVLDEAGVTPDILPDSRDIGFFTEEGVPNSASELIGEGFRPSVVDAARHIENNITDTSDFIGPHFDEPNVLAHLRLNDRVGPNGEKILFIEEIQSDWHQAGRKQGYLPRELNSQANIEDISSEALTGKEVPDAPLKKTWHETAFRRAAAIAADEGYDAIAWTPGKIQAERYDLSQQVDRVVVERAEDGDYLVAIHKDGRELEGQSLSEEELSNYIGKDLADKITGDFADVKISEGDFGISKPKEYSGVDLEVGGEGMKVFYDKMLKNYASKFGKKFDAKVSTIPLERGVEITAVDRTGTPGEWEVWAGRDSVIIKAASEDEARSLALKGKGDFGLADDISEVWSMPVTNKMKSTITKEGVPLFSAVAAPVGALTTGLEEQPVEEAEGIQVASAGSRFLRELLSGRAKGKAARAAEELLVSPRSYDDVSDPTPIEGANFNFERMDTSEEVLTQINTVSDVYAKEIRAAAGEPVPHEVTQDLAMLLGTDEAAATAAVKSLPGDVQDLHVRALTMRNLLVASAERTDELARVIRGGGPDVSDGDYLRFREQIVRYSQLQSQMKGVQTEIARALSSFRIPAEAGLRDPQITSELIDRLGGRSTTQEIADRWLTTPLDKRSKFADRSMFAKTKDAVFEMWINGLLSGLRTHQVNTIGNSVFTIFQIPERAVGAAVGSITKGSDRVRFAESWAMARGMADGTVDGIRLAWKAWRTEMPTDGISKMEAQQHKAISPENFNMDPNSLVGKSVDYIGQGLRLPGRGLMAEDEFFKAIGYRMELRAQTTRRMLQARDDGNLTDLIIDVSGYSQESDEATLTLLRETSMKRNLNGEELGELYDIMLTNPAPDIHAGSWDFATSITFQTQLGEAGKSVQMAASKVPGGRVVLPFIRTPANILKEFSRRSPLALAMPTFYKNLAAGGATRDMAIAKLGMGTGLMTWAYFLSQEGTITGGGPSRSSGTYAQWRATNQPYSMKINGRWHPYGRIEPLAMLFGSVADAVDFIQYSDDEDANEKVYAAAMVGVMQNIGDKSMLQGIANFTDAYSDPNRYAERYIANLSRSTIPFSSMMRDVTRSLDPVMRVTKVDVDRGEEEGSVNTTMERIINEFKASTPGFSNDLPPKRTFWGEERLAYEGGPATAFFAFASKEAKESPIDQEMVRLNTPLNMPSRKIGKYELSHEQYDRLITLMNESPASMASVDLISKYGTKTMRTAMNNLVQSGFWELVESDDIKAEYLKSIRNDYIDGAREALAREDPEIAQAKLQQDTESMMLEGQRGVVKQLGPLSTQ